MVKDDSTDDLNSPADPTSLHLWEFVWVRDLCYIVLILCIVFICVWLRAIVQPVLMALLFAYLVSPLINWCQQRWNWSRLSVVATLCVLIALVLVGLGITLIPLALTQAREFLSRVPAYVDALAERSGVGDDVLLDKLRERTTAFMQDPLTSLSYLWDGVITGFGVVSGVVGTATSFLMGIGLFPVYLFFFSWKWPEIVESLEPFVPLSHRTQVRQTLIKMDKAVGGYFRTRLLIAMLMGIMYSTGWALAGVPFWLLVGIMAGLLGIIPYAATLAWLAAMLLRFLELEGGIGGTEDLLAVFVWPSLVYALVQAADDWLLTPMLQGRELDMSFVTIILAVLIGGAVAGLLGMLMAVPTAACLRIFWSDVIRPRLLSYAESH